MRRLSIKKTKGFNKLKGNFNKLKGNFNKLKGKSKFLVLKPRCWYIQHGYSMLLAFLFIIFIIFMIQFLKNVANEVGKKNYSTKVSAPFFHKKKKNNNLTKKKNEETQKQNETQNTKNETQNTNEKNETQNTNEKNEKDLQLIKDLTTKTTQNGIIPHPLVTIKENNMEKCYGNETSSPKAIWPNSINIKLPATNSPVERRYLQTFPDNMIYDLPPNADSCYKVVWESENDDYDKEIKFRLQSALLIQQWQKDYNIKKNNEKPSTTKNCNIPKDEGF